MSIDFTPNKLIFHYDPKTNDPDVGQVIRIEVSGTTRRGFECNSVCGPTPDVVYGQFTQNYRRCAPTVETFNGEIYQFESRRLPPEAYTDLVARLEQHYPETAFSMVSRML